MDISRIFIPIIDQLFTQFWWLIPLVIAAACLKTPFVKGVVGEWQVNLAARWFLDKHVYHLFDNVTLPTEDGTTQIDHVIVSRYGVFVIETKNMKGWIFGGEHRKTWTQKIYRRSHTFQNPLHQNYKHTRILQSALQLNPDQLFSLVVFVGDSTFKTPMPENVVFAGGYIRFIRKRTQPLLTDFEVQEICANIEAGRLKPSIQTHRDHVRHVKSLVERKQTQPNEQLCPQCGRPMVLRTARRGAQQGQLFFGCSGFPKCRTTRPLT